MRVIKITFILIVTFKIFYARYSIIQDFGITAHQTSKIALTQDLSQLMITDSTDASRFNWNIANQ